MANYWRPVMEGTNVSFSDLLKTVEKDVTNVLLPKDNPSDSREVDALAKAAEGVAIAVDPELAPLFDRIGVLGDYVEQALHEVGTVVGKIKTTIATRAQQVPPPLTPAPVASDPSEPPASADGSTEPSTEATLPADPTGDPSTTTSPGASMSDVTPPADASPEPAPAPVAATPAPAATSDGSDGPPVEAVPAPSPATPGLAPASAIGTPDPALSGAEAAFDALDPADKAAFDTAEGLQAAVEEAQTGSTPPPPA